MPHPVDKGFIRQGKDYTTLICYKKAVIIYDITYYFAHKYLERGDRTIDQMIQAARSGKQNIVEGNIYCRDHNDPADYRGKIAVRSPETICNIAIMLILQADAMTKGLIEWQK